MIKKIALMFFLCMGLFHNSQGQAITQQLRGTLLDHQTKKPLTDVSVMIRAVSYTHLTLPTSP
jgi:hypothetical protein